MNCPVCGETRAPHYCPPPMPPLRNQRKLAEAMKMRMGSIARRVRREEAEARNVRRAERGDAGQLARLELRGHGHCKEAKRLRLKLLGFEEWRGDHDLVGWASEEKK